MIDDEEIERRLHEKDLLKNPKRPIVLGEYIILDNTDVDILLDHMYMLARDGLDFTEVRQNAWSYVRILESLQKSLK